MRNLWQYMLTGPANLIDIPTSQKKKPGKKFPKARLVYREQDQFYDKLDAHIKAGKAVTIAFKDQRLTAESKLWPRLKHCQNWSTLEAELAAIGDQRASRLKPALDTGMTASLACGELVLAYWITLLIALLAGYGIYKGRTVSIKGNIRTQDVQLEIR